MTKAKEPKTPPQEPEVVQPKTPPQEPEVVQPEAANGPSEMQQMIAQNPDLAAVMSAINAYQALLPNVAIVHEKYQKYLVERAMSDPMWAVTDPVKFSEVTRNLRFLRAGAEFKATFEKAFADNKLQEQKDAEREAANRQSLQVIDEVTTPGA